MQYNVIKTNPCRIFAVLTLNGIILTYYISFYCTRITLQHIQYMDVVI